MSDAAERAGFRAQLLEIDRRADLIRAEVRLARARLDALDGAAAEPRRVDPAVAAAELRSVGHEVRALSDDVRDTAVRVRGLSERTLIPPYPHGPHGA